MNMNFQQKCNNPNCKLCLNNWSMNKNIHDIEFPIEGFYDAPAILNPKIQTREEYIQYNGKNNPKYHNDYFSGPNNIFESNISENNITDYIENTDSEHRNYEPERNSYLDVFSNDNLYPIRKPANMCDQYTNKIPNEFIVTDEYLLDYLLKKYKLDKYKLITSIKKLKEQENKICIMKDFYKYNKNLMISYKPFKEHYKFFKQWNGTCIDVSKMELEDYYEKYVKNETN